MKQRIPDYYPDFHCIGSACKDNCCIGWEIDIDPVAWEDYRSQPGAFGERLRTEIDTEGEPHFRLKEDERCPFLNEQNLCAIITTLGARHLCQICDRHPRFYTWLSDCTEAGLGLCCEEAARLILTHRTPVAFLEREAPMKGEQELPHQQPDQWENHLLAARQRALMILQNRTLPIESRVLLLLQYGEELQSCLEENLEQLPELFARWDAVQELHQPIKRPVLSIRQQKGALAWYQQFAGLYQEFEINDPAWMTQLQEIQTRLPEILQHAVQGFVLSPEAAREEEQLLVYGVWRYFMKAMQDHDALSKIHLVFSSWLMHRLLVLAQTEDCSCAQRLSFAVKYSKEIEYSEENIDALLAASFRSSLFGQDALRMALFAIMPAEAALSALTNSL